MSATAKIHTAIIAVMRDIEAVGKSKENSMQKYKFRGIDQVYNALHPLLSKHGIVTIPKVTACKSEVAGTTQKGGNQYRVEVLVEYTFLADDGSAVTAGPIAAEGIDSSDKATNKAMSFAHKYALLQIFCIPTEDIADGDNDHETLGPPRGGWKELQARQGSSAEPAQLPPGPRLVAPTQPSAAMFSVSNVVSAFGTLGINRPALEARIGHDLDACTDEDVLFLQNAYREIKAQPTLAAQHFPPVKNLPPRGRAAALNEKYKTKQPAKN